MDDEKSNKRAATCAGCGGSFERLSAHLARRPKCLRLARTASQDGKECTAGQGADESVAQKVFQDTIRATVVRDLSDLRFGRGANAVSGSAVDNLKRMAADWLRSSERSLVEALEPHISPASGIDVKQLIQSRLNIFDGIGTAKMEQSHARQLYGGRHVPPVQRFMPGSTTDAVWDFPLIDQLQSLISYDRAAALQILSASDSYQARNFEKDPVLRDIRDGRVFRQHLMLGERSRPLLCWESGSDAVKTAWKAYYDDVEVANPLGVARGVHSIGAIYVSLINLHPATRNRLEYTFLVTIAKTSVISKYGMSAVLASCGPSSTTLMRALQPQTDYSLAGQMTMLNSGSTLSFPVNGPFGGMAPRTTYGWLVLFSGDFPAMAKLVGTAASCAAKHPCRHCNWERESAVAFCPSSFMERPLRPADVPMRWKERSDETLSNALAEASKLRSKTARDAQLRSCGYFKSEFVFNSTNFPFLPDTFACTPQDGMHALFSSGIANSEAAEMLYLFISVHKDFTVGDLNDRIATYDWPDGTQITDIHESVKVGGVGGVPVRGAGLRLTGSQTMHFTLHSIDLLAPLVKTVASPAWASWKALVQVVKLYTASSFTLESVAALDAAIADHLRLYQLVPEYSGRLRPKHHFLTHSASDILNFGPPRNFWCFGYEAKNQEVKRAAASSNFKNVLKSAAITLAMQAAKSLMDRTSN